MRALVFGNNVGLLPPVSTLLSRAGFRVDVVSCVAKMIRCDNICKLFLAKNKNELVELVCEKSKLGYDLIIPCDDESIGLILGFSMSIEEKLRILPVTSEKNISHLFSKIGLSNTFSSNNIYTPRYLIAKNEDDIIESLRRFEGGLFIKIDSSGAGRGVFPCNSYRQFEEIKNKIAFPVLVQEKIDGKLIDLSGFFQGGELVYFGYSEILESRPNKLGPSVLRKYHKLSSVSVDVYDRLSELGQVLGVNGFANIGCIQSAEDGNLYFIEADIRPTAWVEYQKFFEEDPAVRIKNYFLSGSKLARDTLSSGANVLAAEETIIIPCFQRLTESEILENKYNCNLYNIAYLGKDIQRWWHRPLAELLLTLGRVFRVGRLSAIGARVWDIYVD